MKKMLVTGFGLGVLLGGVLLLQGCWPLGCSDMGCHDQVTLNFESPLEREGEYEFGINLHGGETITCTATLPNPHGRGLPCSSSKESFLGDAGFSWDSKSESFAGLIIYRAPRSLELVIRHQGEEISRTTHKPSFNTYYPNGEECDGGWGGCQNATVTVPF